MRETRRGVKVPSWEVFVVDSQERWVVTTDGRFLERVDGSADEKRYEPRPLSGWRFHEWIDGFSDPLLVGARPYMGD